MELLGDDLDFREERIELKQPIKKNIPLKIKSSSNLLCTSNNLNQNKNSNIQTTNEITNSLSLNQNPSRPIESNQSYEQNLLKKQPSFEVNKNHIITNLNWNLNINSMSQKLVDHKMDYCMLCYLPILVYGRLIPCKHVMCIQCANNLGFKSCLKELCHEQIDRIEQCARGRIFICHYEQGIKDFDLKEKNQNQPELSQKTLCGRSYMSQRDLDAHIKHRHDPNLKVNDYETSQN